MRYRHSADITNIPGGRDHGDRLRGMVRPTPGAEHDPVRLFSPSVRALAAQVHSARQPCDQRHCNTHLKPHPLTTRPHPYYLYIHHPALLMLPPFSPSSHSGWGWGSKIETRKRKTKKRQIKTGKWSNCGMTDAAVALCTGWGSHPPPTPRVVRWHWWEERVAGGLMHQCGAVRCGAGAVRVR